MVLRWFRVIFRTKGVRSASVGLIMGQAELFRFAAPAFPISG